MGFSKLKTGTQTNQAPASVATAPPPAKTPVVEVVKTVEAVVVPTVAQVEKAAAEIKTVAVNTAPATKTLSVFGGGGSMAAALLAVTEMVEQTPVVFPVLALSGGNTGGMFTPASFVPEEVANQLPQGKKPVDCVFMGYRTELSAWPVGFNDKKDGDKPSFSLAVSCADADGARMVGTAAQAYQFTKGDKKKAWDYAESGLGHLRPTLQVLIYLPAVDDVIVLQTPAHYTSWKSSMENLKKLMDPSTGELSQAPCQIRAISTPKVINGNTVTEHVLDFTVQANDTGKQWYAGYAKYIQQAAADEETREKIENWVNCVDRPLSDDHRALLRKAAGFKP